MFNNIKPVRTKPDKCKIKIKKSPTGKEIIFSGDCSKEQISIAKENLGVNDSQEI